MAGLRGCRGTGGEASKASGHRGKYPDRNFPYDGHAGRACTSSGLHAMRNATPAIGVPCDRHTPRIGFAAALRLWCGIVVVPRGENLIMRRTGRFSFIVIAALLCLAPRSGEAAPGTASDVVRHFYDALLDTMKNAGALG